MSQASQHLKTLRKNGVSIVVAAAAIVGAGVILSGCGKAPHKPVKTRVSSNARKVDDAIQSVVSDIAHPERTRAVAPVNFEMIDEMRPIIHESQLPFEAWSDQQVAADALSRIGQPAVPQLIETLSNPDPQIRRATLSVLSRMGPDAKDAVPTLIQLLDDEDAEVRRSAAKTLGRIGPEAAQAVPALVRSLTDSKPTRPELPASHYSPTLHDPLRRETEPGQPLRPLPGGAVVKPLGKPVNPVPETPELEIQE